MLERCSMLIPERTVDAAYYYVTDRKKKRCATDYFGNDRWNRERRVDVAVGIVRSFVAHKVRFPPDRHQRPGLRMVLLKAEATSSFLPGRFWSCPSSHSRSTEASGTLRDSWSSFLRDRSQSASSHFSGVTLCFLILPGVPFSPEEDVAPSPYHYYMRDVTLEG